MGRAWVCVAVLGSSGTAFAGPRVEVDLGLTVDHVSGGSCDDSGFVAVCGARWGASLRLEAGQTWPVEYGILFVTREALGGGVVAGSTWSSITVRAGTTWLVRGYFGAGGRLQVSTQLYVEMTAGIEPQLGTTGTGDGGIASGSDLALSPRVGVRFGRWSLVLEGLLAPGAIDQLGLADYDIGVLASGAFGD